MFSLPCILKYFLLESILKTILNKEIKVPIQKNKNMEIREKITSKKWGGGKKSPKNTAYREKHSSHKIWYISASQNYCSTFSKCVYMHTHLIHKSQSLMYTVHLHFCDILQRHTHTHTYIYIYIYIQT